MREDRGSSRGRRSSGPGATVAEHEGGALTDPETLARSLCLGWLSLRPHTRAELATKLRRKEIPDEAATVVLDRYDEVGLIDDAAFAKAWVGSRHAGRGLSRRALSYELRHRGVENELIDAAVAELDPATEEATARALVERKLVGMRNVSADARARRLIGLLARKGYPAGLAARLVREAVSNLGVEIPDPDDPLG